MTAKGDAMKRSILWASVLVLFLAVSCSDDPTTPGTGNLPDSKSLKAIIDGEDFVADEATISITGVPGQARQGTLVISGTDPSSGRTLTLTLSFMGSTMPKPLGVNPLTTPGGTGSVVFQDNVTTQTWVTPLNGESGSVAITNRTPTRIAGTFEFSAVATEASIDPSMRSVSGGKFNIV